MVAQAGSRSVLVSFLAGALASLAAVALYLLWQGEAPLGRLSSIGAAGTAVGLGVLLFTVVLPCGILGLAGRGGPIAAFGRGLLLPLGILAVDGLSLAAGVEEENPDPFPEVRTVIPEALRVVWRPLRSAAGTGGGEVERAGPFSRDALEARIRELTAERDGLRLTLEGMQSAPPTAPDPAEIAGRSEELETARREVETLRRRLRTEEQTREALQKSVAGQQGMLEAAKAGLLEARREAETAKTELAQCRRDLLLAKGETEAVRDEMAKQIAALGEGALAKEVRRLRQSAFLPVGVILEAGDSESKGVVAIRTTVDASRVSGTVLAIGPRGTPTAVLRCGIG
jgi:hypothetical protein